MKRIVTILIILAVSLTCLASCSGKKTINVEDEWHAIINGERDVVGVANLFGIGVWSSTATLVRTDPELIKNVVEYLKVFDTHIGKEIIIDDTSSEEYESDWLLSSYGGITLYICTGEKDETSSMSSVWEYDYSLEIKFLEDVCRITISDVDREFSYSAHYKYDGDIDNYMEDFNEIFNANSIIYE